MAKRPEAPGRRREKVTLRDVADRAGVGVMTVSRALNAPEVVSAKLRARVDDAVRELGYVPNRYAESLASARTRLVTVIVPSLSGRVFGDIIVGADEVLSPNDYQIMVSNTAYSLQDEEMICRRVLGWRPEGVIVSGVDHTPGTRKLLIDAGIPVVEALELGADPIDFNIGLSHYDAGWTAGEHLIARGYRRPAFIGAQMDFDFRARRRRAGFVAALGDAGLPLVRDIAHPGAIGYASGGAAFTALIAADDKVDSVFCVNDELAVGAMAASLRTGRRVPDDLAVIGFNNLDISANVVPALTTIGAPRRLMGRLAAQALLGDEFIPKKVDVGFELVVREST